MSQLSVLYNYGIMHILCLSTGWGNEEIVIRFSTLASGPDIVCWHYTCRNKATGYTVSPSGFQ